MATVTKAVTVTVTKTIASTTASSTLRVASQDGIIGGSDPSVYDPKNPIIIFIIQAGIILLFCRLLHYPLARLRQPRVIAEVIGGVLLGPSVMGRIPGFTATIFPSAAMPNLTLVANLGLVLFLFLVGLEVDLRYLVSNWRVALSVGFAGMALPFGLGCAIAWGLYHQFGDEPGTVPIKFGTYMLFVGVAMAITAFPVLCRILTELKLLSTPVGIIVLSAGVGNDVVGWILLALCVALVNAGTGITALYVLLTALAYVLFLTFAVRPAFLWLLRRTNSLQNGPSQSVVALTLLIALASAFFTGVIGVHPIFGAFMAGLICPHEGGFAIKVTEKVEDLVGALFLPLYFALSGLSTDLGLLDTGVTWAYVVGVVAVAFFGKVIGGALAARFNGLVWRESFTIGALMSCKGLVELIVLNIGLQAKILSTRTFTIFVVMAIVTTFATTPLTSLLYPPQYQRKLSAWKRGEIDWDSGEPTALMPASDDVVAVEKRESKRIGTLLVYLRLDSMPTLIAFTALLGGKAEVAPTPVHPSLKAAKAQAQTQPPTSPTKRPIQVHGLRLLELTQRASSVMKSASAPSESCFFDPLINTFRTFGFLHNLSVSGAVATVPETSYASVLASKAADTGVDLLLLPWSEDGRMAESLTLSEDAVEGRLESSAYASFVAQVMEEAATTVAVFVERGFGAATVMRPRLERQTSAFSIASLAARDFANEGAVATRPRLDRSHHIFMPFFGGRDDWVAARLVLQLAESEMVTATIVRFADGDTAASTATSTSTPTGNKSKHEHTTDIVVAPALSSRPTPAPVMTTTPNASRAQQQQRDADASFFATLSTSLPSHLRTRVLLTTISTPAPLESALQRAKEEVGQNPRNAGDLVVVGKDSYSGFGGAGEGGDGGEGGQAGVGVLGQVAEMMLQGVSGGSVLVVRAGGRGE